LSQWGLPWKSRSLPQAVLVSVEDQSEPHSMEVLPEFPVASDFNVLAEIEEVILPVAAPTMRQVSHRPVGRLAAGNRSPSPTKAG